MFGVEDEDLYATGTIEDALYDGTLKVYELPSAERQGRWIDITKCGGYSVFKCSECGDLQLEESYYCPNCGSFNGEDNLNEKL